MRRWLWPVWVGVLAFACGSDGDGDGGAGGSAGLAAGTSNAGTNQQSAGKGQGGGANAGQNAGGSQAQAGSSSQAGSGGSKAGTSNGGTGGIVMCPPCAAPPAPDCVGSGPCGCGPYVCPNGGADGEGEPCGPVSCSPPLECCNPLMGTCVMPGQVCAQ